MFNSSFHLTIAFTFMSRIIRTTFWGLSLKGVRKIVLSRTSLSAFLRRFLWFLITEVQAIQITIQAFQTINSLRIWVTRVIPRLLNCWSSNTNNITIVFLESTHQTYINFKPWEIGHDEIASTLNIEPENMRVKNSKTWYYIWPSGSN